jgi:hypothetical protein
MDMDLAAKLNLAESDVTQKKTRSDNLLNEAKKLDKQGI